MNCFLCKNDGGISCSNKHIICLNCLFEIVEKNYDEWLKEDELVLEYYKKTDQHNLKNITKLLNKHITNLINLNIIKAKKIKHIFFVVEQIELINCPICKEIKKTKKRIFK